MARILNSIRLGDWLEKDRMLVYPLVIMATTVVSIAYVLFSHGGVLPNGSPFGADFVSFWVAAREALAGHPETPYLVARFAAAQDAIFGDGNVYAFYYPPHFLAYMLPFGALPYYLALATWLAASFAAALWALTQIAGRRIEVLVLALAFPATFLTVAHGQNAFLSAALFGGGLALLRTRPVLAGILFGLMTFKPQLGLLIPLALIAGGNWRTILSAGATAVLAAAFSAVLFGPEIWALFLQQGGDAMATLRDGVVDRNKMLSVYAMLRLVGTGHSTAVVLQSVVSVLVAAAVTWAWFRKDAITYDTRAVVLLSGALLATPFVLSYDLFLLAPALAFIGARGATTGFQPYEKSMLAFLYCAPFLILGLMAVSLPIAPFVLALPFLRALKSAVDQSRHHAGNALIAAE
ncbi:glycosyltransferase family 87 protein [Oricola sp.]|uniref:glycosyltransferase family 87 protein n=1 Tax=Oricola sp. TaxID=1979950 RepID=UPI00351119AA